MRMKRIIHLLLAFLPVIAVATLRAAPPPPQPQQAQQQPVLLTPSIVKKAKLILVNATARTDRIFLAWQQDDAATAYKIYRGGAFLAQVQKHTPAADYLTGDEWTEVMLALGVIKKPGESFSYGQFHAAGKVGEVDRNEIRWLLAQLHAGAARAMGLGYLDTNVEAGKKYKYQVKKIVNGKEIDWGGEQEVTARDYRLDMVMPTAGQVIGGDQRIALYWPRNEKITAYDVYRDGKKVNGLPVTTVGPKPAPAQGHAGSGQYALPAQTTLTIQNAETVHFFVDQTKLAQDKNDPKKTVILDELKNGVHQYKIVPRDLLGAGQGSLNLTGTAQDFFPPAPPDPLTFETVEDEWTLPAAKSAGCCNTCSLCQGQWNPPAAGGKHKYFSGLKIAWNHVRWNTEGLPEKVASYKVYRYDSVQAATNDKNGTGGDLAGTVTVPLNPMQLFATIVVDKGIKPELMYWYRVFAWDQAGHVTGSGVFSASFRDNRPPLAPDFVSYEYADSSETQITINWAPCADSDLAGYRIYRRVCGAKPVQVPYNGGLVQNVGAQAIKPSWTDDQFRLIKTIPVAKTLTPSQTQALNQMSSQTQSGNQMTLKQSPPANTATGLQVPLSYADVSLPEMSPLCYEYVVRAFDRSQNVSLDTKGNITCGRLHDTKGPEAPTITALKARGNSIRIEWVAPPTPDLFTFRIQRSENGTNWSEIQTDPAFPAKIKCEDTPPEGREFAVGLGPGMHEGKDKNTYWLEDAQGIKPNVKYYYRVVAVDYLQNPKTGKEEGSVLPVMTTFTYEQFQNDAPAVQAPVFNPQRGVTLVWSIPGGVTGVTYIVHRSAKSAGEGFLPLAAGLTKTEYADAAARPGVQYWYKVQYVTAAGHYSAFSNVVSCTPPMT